MNDKKTNCIICDKRKKKKGDFCRRCNSARNKLIHRVPQLKDGVDQINTILKHLDIGLHIRIENLDEVYKIMRIK